MTLAWPRLVWGSVAARITYLESQWNRWRDVAERQAAVILRLRAAIARLRKEVDDHRAVMNAIAPIPDPQPVAEAVRSLTGGPRTSADVPDWIARAREQGL